MLSNWQGVVVPDRVVQHFGRRPLVPHSKHRTPARQRCVNPRLSNFPDFSNFLAADWLKKVVNERPNIVQSMLEAFARCHPLPELKPELLTFLAKTHNAWMHAIAPLETRITVECAFSPSLVLFSL